MPKLWGQCVGFLIQVVCQVLGQRNSDNYTIARTMRFLNGRNGCIGLHWAEHGCNGLQLGDDDDADDDDNDDKLYEKCWASWKVGSGKTKGLALIRRFLP